MNTNFINVLKAHTHWTQIQGVSHKRIQLHTTILRHTSIMMRSREWEESFTPLSLAWERAARASVGVILSDLYTVRYKHINEFTIETRMPTCTWGLPIYWFPFRWYPQADSSTVDMNKPTKVIYTLKLIYLSVRSQMSVNKYMWPSCDCHRGDLRLLTIILTDKRKVNP